MSGELHPKQQEAMQKIVMSDFFVSVTIKDGKGSVTSNAPSNEKAIELLEQVISVFKQQKDGSKNIVE